MALQLIILFLIIVILVSIYRNLYPKPLPGIPYGLEAASRILGDIPDLFAHIKKTKEVSSYSVVQCRKLGSPIIQVFLRPFARPFIFIDDPRETEDLLLRRPKEFDRAPSTSAIFRTVLPHASIVKTTTPEFRAQRRLWQDVMTPEFLRCVVAPNVHRSALELIELWRLRSQLAKGHPFEAHHDLETAAFDAIWIAVLGSDLGGMKSEIITMQNAASSAIDLPHNVEDPALFPAPERSEMYQTMTFLNKSVEKVMGSPIRSLRHWMIRQTPIYKKYNAIRHREIRRILRTAYDRFQRLLENDTEVKEQHDTCAMDLVLRRELVAARKAGVHPSDPERNLEMQDELLMLLVAGHETTANTLSWFVKFMAANPEAQSALRTILEEAFHITTDSPHSLPSATEILTSEIPYLDAVIEETNRLANTVPLIVREATVDTHILGQRVPAGTTIMCNSQVTAPPVGVPAHLRSPTSQAAMEKLPYEGLDSRDANLSVFEPRRWLTVNDDHGREGFDAYALPRLAFSLGTRGCF
ncbi:hypothetical protein Egran_02264, partial [Elaphomyces granulatus]